MQRNVKKIGNDFESECAELLNNMGYWVHFITPNKSGAQPFDFIAVKGGEAWAIDAKTCVSNTFNINRVEDNQAMAFDKWLRCGNTPPYFLVKHNDAVYRVWWQELKRKGSVKLDDCERIKQD